MSSRSFLKQAGGSSLDNPNEDESILAPDSSFASFSSSSSDQDLLDALPDERAPRHTPPASLRYTQEVPFLEQIFATLASNSLKSSGFVSSSYSLDDALAVLADLLQQAVADGQEERVGKLLALQDQFAQLPAQLSKSDASLRASSDIYLARPALALKSTPLRRSHLQFRPSSSSSSEVVSPAPGTASQPCSSQPCSSNTVTCPICYDDFPFESLATLEDCRAHRFCAECLGLHLASQINEAQVGNLSCPGLNCKVSASDQDIAELVSPEVYDRYLRFSVFAYYKEEQPIECPNVDCQSPLFPAEQRCRGERFVQCPACAVAFCTVCSRLAHPDTDCAGEDYSLAAWRESKAKNTVKKCFKCNTYVEKNLGCNHITCKCEAQWCWLCEDNYEAGHFSQGFCNGFQFNPANDLIEATRAEHTKTVLKRVGHKYIRELTARHNAEYHRWCLANPPTLRVGRKWKRTPELRAEWEIQKQRQDVEFEALVNLQSVETQQLLNESLRKAQEHLDAIKLKRQTASTSD